MGPTEKYVYTSHNSIQHARQVTIVFNMQDNSMKQIVEYKNILMNEMNMKTI